MREGGGKQSHSGNLLHTKSKVGEGWLKEENDDNKNLGEIEINTLGRGAGCDETSTTYVSFLPKLGGRGGGGEASE